MHIKRFFSHLQASRHYKCDFRTAKNKYFNVEYVLDKSSNSNPNSNLKQCLICSSFYASSKGRHGRCPNCKRKQKERTVRICKLCNTVSSKLNIVNSHLICKTCSIKGLGRKLQGEKISKQYLGDKNPNYVHGTSTIKIWQDSKWVSLRKKYNNKICCKCSSVQNIHLHHIIPQCLLTYNEKFNLNNIIPLCSNHHKELHHLQLDIVLLPILYLQYKKDVQGLQQLFFDQPQFQSMSLTGDEKYSKLSLLQLTPRNYYKIIQNLHPEFFQQEFDHLVLK